MASKQTKVKPKPVRFDQRLVLQRWFLSLFGVEKFEDIASGLSDPDLEGYDENNQSRFYHHLTARLFDKGNLSNEQLLRYDDNIYSHTLRISEKREERIAWKYFQYLSLLATEIYLDRWFTNRGELCVELNDFLEKFNEDLPLNDRINDFTPSGLSKLAFWSATGSGKTLLMHVHLLQYLHYLAKHKVTDDINKVLLITPNESLSQQHLEELQASNIPAELFTKSGTTDSLFGSRATNRVVEIIDIHKIKEGSKEKTVAVESFENNNLVFIDEGHRGAGGDVIKRYRDTLSEEGFAFEYSATFGQSIKAATSKKRTLLEQEYAKAILFDYSYRYFYRDGYGKDYKILNLDDDKDEQVRKLYLTASLLTFYQQIKLYGSNKKQWEQYLLAQPLWILVGGKVTAVRTVGGRQVSDVVDILLFIKYILDNRDSVTRDIHNLLSGKTGLTTSSGKDSFANNFTYLSTLKITAADVYTDILKEVFLSTGGGQLHVENLKGIDGEIGLRVGNGDYFGVINVGDDAALLKLCSDNKLMVSDRDFSQSLFHEIKSPESTVNILIGSKKFTEGWSSWRVSMMGLMNIGRSEGSEIIQLFGRGVRLKGKGMSLKRSKMLLGDTPPKFIGILETLNIFGVRADYMKTFKDYLEGEGLPGDETIEICLPVIRSFDPKKKRLKVLRINPSVSFKRDGGKVDFDLALDSRVSRVELDYYPKLQSLTGGVSDGIKQEPETGVLLPAHTAFFDYQEMYFELQKYKYEKSWYNVNISINGIKTILADTSWYRLYVPKQQLTMADYNRVLYWQEMATSLLKKYMHSLYNYRKSEWEEPYLEYQELTEDDPNFTEEYQAYVSDSETSLIEKLSSLRTLLESSKKKKAALDPAELRKSVYGGFTPFMFSEHLYQPLVHIESGSGLQINIKPVHLNEGEYRFVCDLESYYKQNTDVFRDRELYLLRNKSKEGIGFFEAGNFYPDFIMWILDGDTQHIVFIDPKGIRNMDLEKDLKLNFHSKIKEKEKQLNDTNIRLSSFIVSGTPFDSLINYQGKKKDLEDKNILFQQQGNPYIEQMFRRLMTSSDIFS